jgi:tripartite-type tricarboxylate transporter receptor subunit TctC
MPPAMIALLSGQIEILFPGVNTVQQHLRSGKLRALAVTTKVKSPALPELPTLDSFYPGFDIDNWYMLFAPAGTPNAIVSRLHGEVEKSLKHPEIIALMQNEGAVPVGSTQAEAATFFRREIENYARIVKASGAKADN